jgi:hypothetical protein
MRRRTELNVGRHHGFEGAIMRKEDETVGGARPEVQRQVRRIYLWEASSEGKSEEKGIRDSLSAGIVSEYDLIHSDRCTHPK